MTVAVKPYRKAAIPNAVRREVALRYGCPPGGEIEVECHYCPRRAAIHWFTLSSGRPSSWVWFGHELDHVIPEYLGGPTIAENIVLACRRCNRSKGARV